MTPVRVKLYGLVSVTRRRYLWQLVVALVLAAVLLLAWYFYWPAVRTQLMAAESPVLDRLIVFWNVAPAVVLSILALQGIEAWFVLRLFARKEAEAARRQLCRLGRRSEGEFLMAAQHPPRFLAIVNDAKSRIKETNVDAVKARLDQGEKLTIIDVREESEFARDHVAGSVHLGKGILERDIEQKFPDPSVELILYCGGGFRSALAADNLQKMGYTNVISMDGGIRDWRNRGYPLES